jgi:hypothetical protein
MPRASRGAAVGRVARADRDRRTTVEAMVLTVDDIAAIASA